MKCKVILNKLLHVPCSHQVEVSMQPAIKIFTTDTIPRHHVNAVQTDSLGNIFVKNVFLFFIFDIEGWVGVRGACYALSLCNSIPYADAPVIPVQFNIDAL